jgi:hypothetical protein
VGGYCQSVFHYKWSRHRQNLKRLQGRDFSDEEHNNAAYFSAGGGDNILYKHTLLDCLGARKSAIICMRSALCKDGDLVLALAHPQHLPSAISKRNTPNTTNGAQGSKMPQKNSVHMASAKSSNVRGPYMLVPVDAAPKSRQITLQVQV